MANNQWWVVYPASQGIINNPTGQKIVETTLGDAPSRAWASNGSYQGWQVLMGPFNSQAEAKAAKPGAISVGTWIGSGLAGLLTGLGNQPSPSTSVGTGMAVGTGIDSALGALGLHGDFRHLMLRVVEVLLGGILVIVALEEVMKATGSNNIIQGVKKYGKMVK